MRTMGLDIYKEVIKESLTPIKLFRINLSDTPEATGEEDLFLTDNPLPVNFFKREDRSLPTDPDVYTAQEYTPYVIKCGAISENAEGKIDGVDISIGNADRIIAAFLLERDLRGRKVNIWEVFEGLLDDEANYAESIYYIDTWVMEDTQVNFRLISRLDLLDVDLPHRVWTRNYCWNTYKGNGCWYKQPDGSFVAPSGFNAESTAVFWCYEADRVDDSLATIALSLTPIDLINFDPATDKFLVELMCDFPARLTSGGRLEIGSGGTFSNEVLRYANPAALGITTSWQTFEIPFASGWTAFGSQAYNPRHTNYIGWYQPFTAGGDVTIYLRNARVQRLNPFSFETGSADSCNKTWENCVGHNNTRQFGGGHSIPKEKFFRI